MFKAVRITILLFILFMVAMGTNPRISNRGHAANDAFKRMSEDDDVTLVAVPAPVAPALPAAADARSLTLVIVP